MQLVSYHSSVHNGRISKLKMLCLHLTFNPYLSSETYSRKYEKLPNTVIHACKNITEKMNLSKMCGLQNRLCLFTFRPIPSKQFNSLTAIDILSRLGCAVVTHLLWVLDFPAPARDFVLFFCYVVFLLFVQKHIICYNILQFSLQSLFI